MLGMRHRAWQVAGVTGSSKRDCPGPHLDEFGKCRKQVLTRAAGPTMILELDRTGGRNRRAVAYLNS